MTLGTCSSTYVTYDVGLWQCERDVEWKFARTELWLTFIEPGTPVPPPFNVIPSPRNIWRAILWLCRRSDLKFFLPHEGKQVRYAAVQVSDLVFLRFRVSTLVMLTGIELYGGGNPWVIWGVVSLKVWK